jgi:hypothetical protein
VDSRPECQNLICGQVCVCVKFTAHRLKPSLLPKIKLRKCEEYQACPCGSEPTLICRTPLPTITVSLGVTVWCMHAPTSCIVLFCVQDQRPGKCQSYLEVLDKLYKRSINQNKSTVCQTFCFSNYNKLNIIVTGSNLFHVLLLQGRCNKRL